MNLFSAAKSSFSWVQTTVVQLRALTSKAIPSKTMTFLLHGGRGFSQNSWFLYDSVPLKFNTRVQKTDEMSTWRKKQAKLVAKHLFSLFGCVHSALFEHRERNASGPEPEQTRRLHTWSSHFSHFLTKTARYNNISVWLELRLSSVGEFAVAERPAVLVAGRGSLGFVLTFLVDGALCPGKAFLVSVDNVARKLPGPFAKHTSA